MTDRFHERRGDLKILCSVGYDLYEDEEAKTVVYGLIFLCK